MLDEERRRRFVQEAKSASALNHPNIVTIYDIDEADGVHFIAMEYVAGETLDAVIGRRGLPLKNALRYAAQIADGLAKAHAAGIIHRDLKPSNLMITTDGAVKILDFGLAKLVERAEPSEATRTMTMAPPATEEGKIFGTVAYMSPEQAEGKPVDARTDIFSFGSVLYSDRPARVRRRNERVRAGGGDRRDPPSPSGIAGGMARIPRHPEQALPAAHRSPGQSVVPEAGQVSGQYPHKLLQTAPLDATSEYSEGG